VIAMIMPALAGGGDLSGDNDRCRDAQHGFISFPRPHALLVAAMFRRGRWCKANKALTGPPSGPSGRRRSSSTGPLAAPEGVCRPASRKRATVLYHQIPPLFAALALARGDGRYAKLLRSLARVDLLVLDDWGPDQLDAEQRRDLLEIVEDRYDARSIIITSQIPVERWYEIIGNPTLADAILDRIIHNAFRIPAEGRGRGTVACRWSRFRGHNGHAMCGVSGAIVRSVATPGTE
jgi:hypothetical protein